MGLNKIALVTVTIASTFFVNPARASTVLFSDPATKNGVIGIEDLIIGRTHYNVSFNFGTIRSIIGDSSSPDFKSPPFWNSQSDALNASNIISSTINSENPLARIDYNNPQISIYGQAFFVLFNNSTPGFTSFINACSGSGSWVGDCGTGVVYSDFSSAGIASIQEVPEPLNILGVITGLAFFRIFSNARKKKNLYTDSIKKKSSNLLTSS